MNIERTLDVIDNHERRSKPRMYCSYPAIIQGRDGRKLKFRANAMLTNLSANGLCLLLKGDIQLGKALFILFRCSTTGPLGNGKAPLIAVVRTNHPDEEMHQVGIRILKSRFLLMKDK